MLPLTGNPPAAPVTPPPSAAAGGALLAAVVATALGAMIAGVPGAAAGLLLAGGSRNAYVAGRDWSSEDKLARADAGKAGLLALVELGAAGWTVYSLNRKQ